MFTTFLFASPKIIFARIGVGVGTGQINIDENLRSGIIYQLPPIAVLNTGDEESDYGMEISYNQDQVQKSPSQDWFTFDPPTFHLRPGEVKNINVTLKLPLKTVPGKYFAYVEAHPVKQSDDGTTRISIAAAAKLYFTVLPSNIFVGIYFRVLSFWLKYTPYTNIAASLIGTIILILIFKKFFKLNIQVKK